VFTFAPNDANAFTASLWPSDAAQKHRCLHALGLRGLRVAELWSTRELRSRGDVASLGRSVHVCHLSPFRHDTWTTRRKLEQIQERRPFHKHTHDIRWLQAAGSRLQGGVLGLELCDLGSACVSPSAASFNACTSSTIAASSDLKLANSASGAAAVPSSRLAK
jgi:hypothetical protein